MRLLGHPGSDLDETWWKLFPGVSRSFLNSSGTKITGKNTKKMILEISKKRVINCTSPLIFLFPFKRSFLVKGIRCNIKRAPHGELPRGPADCFLHGLTIGSSNILLNEHLPDRVNKKYNRQNSYWIKKIKKYYGECFFNVFPSKFWFPDIWRCPRGGF